MKHQQWHRRSPADGGFSVLELLVVISIFGIIAAIAVPMAKSTTSAYEIAGQAHAVAYDISLAKMQAASGFTQARLYVDLSNNSYHIETWNKATNAWVVQGAVASLPSGIGFGFSTLATPPSNTQGVIGQASACHDASDQVVASTACVLFNSRGVPVDTTGTPTGADAVYLTDGGMVYGVTVTPAGLTQLWSTPARTAAWQKQ
jgi:prepilin-type N-terminal cleavage/methylation domain-containing protein